MGKVANLFAKKLSNILQQLPNLIKICQIWATCWPHVHQLVARVFDFGQMLLTAGKCDQRSECYLIVLWMAKLFCFHFSSVSFLKKRIIFRKSSTQVFRVSFHSSKLQYLKLTNGSISCNSPIDQPRGSASSCDYENHRSKTK